MVGLNTEIYDIFGYLMKKQVIRHASEKVLIEKSQKSVNILVIFFLFFLNCTQDLPALHSDYSRVRNKRNSRPLFIIFEASVSRYLRTLDFDFVYEFEATL